MEPWCDKRVWERTIQRPVQEGCLHAQDALMRMLQPSRGGIMWRTSKNSVAKELGIPAQVCRIPPWTHTLTGFVFGHRACGRASQATCGYPLFTVSMTHR